MILRPYQNELEAAIYRAWNEQQHRNVLAVMPTGAGKSISVASIINQHQGVSCLIAHRQELVCQLSMALARFGVRHKIIGPTKVIRYIISEQIAELGTSFYDPNSQCAVAGVNTLVRRADKLKHFLNQVTLWVTDECFPAGTLIDETPIEQIKIGDYVNSFNEKTGKFEQRKVVRLFKKPAPDYMVRLQIGHHVLYCTGNHPIWTNKGWVNAEKITKQHQVYMVQESDHSDDRISTLQLAKKWKNILFKNWVRLQIQRRTSKEKNQEAAHNDHMFYLQEASAGNIQLQENRESLLWYWVFKYLPFKKIIGDNDQDEFKTCVKENEEKQSNAQTRSTSESVSNVKSDGVQTDSARRQRETSNKSRSVIKSTIFRTRVCSSSQYKNRPSNGGWFRIPSCIQTRPRTLWFKVSNRSRRAFSWSIGTSTTGQEERQIFKWVRVDSVEVQKRCNIKDTRGSCSDGNVYNIEVEGLHTYVAEGIVVHNCHHILRENSWGKAAALMPNARGLGVTATPIRADGKGLGRHADGVMDVIVEGPSMRWLIDNNYLTDYRVFAPPSDLDLTDVTISQATGDYNPKKLKTAVQESHLVGDVVSHYLRLAKGKKGITFATDIETATEISVQFNQAGVPSEVISSKTPERIRNHTMKRLASGEILNLVNVDICGEGVDVPAVEVASLARPTQSYGLHIQQFGRPLRLMKGKTHALIIDHASNVVRHGLPDMEREWSLDSRGSSPRGKSPEDDIPLRYCVECTQPYERIYSKCPWCGHVHEPAGRSKPEYVDGDLTELTPEILAEMRGDIGKVDESAADVGERMKFAGAPIAAVNGAMKNIVNKQEAQAALRKSISWWAGIQRHRGRTDSESYKMFYFCFGIDVLSAQMLGRPDAIKLATRINTFMGMSS